MSINFLLPFIDSEDAWVAQCTEHPRAYGQASSSFGISQAFAVGLGPLPSTEAIRGVVVEKFRQHIYAFMGRTA